jgi:predicted permease
MMLPLRVLLSRVLGVFTRRRSETELSEEMQAHLDLLASEHIRHGMSLDAARAAARRAFGGVEQVKESYRDQRGLPLLDDLLRDVRMAVRALRRTPVFTATAILTLALAIGANASIFSLINALLLRPLAVKDPEQLVELAAEFRTGMKVPLSFPMFREFAKRQEVLSALIGSTGTPILTIEANGGLSPGVINAVTGNFYSELGVTPAAGRLLGPADVNLETFTGAPVAVLGYGLWQRRFGSDLKAIGSVVRVQGVPFTVVGIAPNGFKGFEVLPEPDVTVPLTASPIIFRSTDLDYLNSGGLLWIRAAGRMRRGVTVEQARAQLEAAWPGIKSDVMPATHAGARRENFLAMRLRVESLATGQETSLRPRFTRPLYFLLGIALVVLLIACMNIASFMLPRVVGRSHDLAVRMALGASQRQATQHVVVETVVISLAAACAGIGLAYWTSAAAGKAMLGNMLVATNLNTAPDLRVLGFTAIIAAGAGLLSAAAPAWLMTRSDPRGLLQQSRQKVSPPNRVSRILIAGQVALAVVLLTNAGLIVRSFQQLLALDPGFSAEEVVRVNFQMRPESETHPDIGTYYPTLIDRVKALPAVQQAALSHGSVAQGAFVQQVSRMSSEAADGIPAAFNSVSPGFFDSLGIRIIQGRDFTWADQAIGPRVAILGRSLANRLFPGEDPLRNRVRIGTQPYRQDLEVVGIVADTRLYDLKDSVSYAAYVPALQVAEPMTGGFLFIRGHAIGEDQLQRAVQSAGPDYVAQFEPLTDVLGSTLLSDRLTASVAVFFGMLTLVLAAIGIGGLVGFVVFRRKQEIAIRLALGATPRTILKAILKENVAITGVGLAIGLAAASLSTRPVQALLFGIGPHDPMVLFGVPAVLLVVAISACLVPASRAALIDPSNGLRAE